MDEGNARHHREEELGVMQSGVVAREEVRAKDKDGLERVWEQTKAPLFDRHGALIGVGGISRDISRRFQEYEGLVEGLKRFRSLFESVTMIAVQGFDEQRRVIYWNKSSEEFYGYREVNVIGKPIEGLIVPSEERDAFCQAHQAWVMKGQPIEASEVSALHRDGHTIPVFSHYVSAHAPGGVREFYRVDFDLRLIREQEAELKHLNNQLEVLNQRLEEEVDARTRELLESNNQLRREINIRHQTAEELSRSEEKYRRALELSSDAIFLVIPENGHIIEANAAACSLVGQSFGQLKGYEMDLLLYKEDGDRFREALKVCFSGETESVSGDFSVQHSSGRRVYVSITSSQLSLQEEDFFMFVMHDITSRKRAEEENELALQNLKDLNELKQQFITLVTHEVRTPLTAIASSSELLDQHFEKLGEDRRARHLQNIAEAVTRIRELTDGVTFISRVQEGRLSCDPEDMDLVGFCHEIIDFLEPDEQTARIEFRYDEVLSKPVRLDRQLLKLMLMNLLQNALKYSGEEKPVELVLLARADRLEIVVSDEGIGIPAGEQKHLFDSFFRASNVRDLPGTGLGLHITQNAVEAHRGRISWETQESSGTRFIISLPLSFKHEDNIGN